MGVMPVAGLPLFFCLADIDLAIFIAYQKSRPEGSGNFQPALTPAKEGSNMADADSKTISTGERSGGCYGRCRKCGT
jgi:hypothetical protein